MAVFSACKKAEVNYATISINAAGESFVNGEAELIIALSEAEDHAVNYEIKVSGSVPEEKLDFKSTDVIPIGTSVVTLPVKVDTEGMEDGDYEAVFTLYSAVGAVLNPEMKSVTILLNVISADN